MSAGLSECFTPQRKVALQSVTPNDPLLVQGFSRSVIASESTTVRMRMMFLRKFELAGGMATGVLGGLAGIVAPFVRYGVGIFELYRSWPGLLIGDLISFVIPGLLVAVGSYVHSVGRKSWGFVLVLVVGIFLVLIIPIHFFGGVFYFYGLWGGLLRLSPSAVALLTVIAAFQVRRSAR